ncbi:MAG: DUF5686 and carboxypeptidase regulatory-like domain-containing protein [Bacteroidota bacterium]
MRFAATILFFFAFWELKAAVVKGTITDEQGGPIPYASVFVKNSTYGVTADLKGYFFIELKPGQYTLIFSCISYENLERTVTLTDSKPLYLNIILKESATQIGEISITSGNRDLAKDIMKKVIDKRGEYWGNIENYKCVTYQKSSLEKVLVKQPKIDSAKIKADSVKRAELLRDTTKSGKKKKDINEVFKDGKLNLIESLSETYFAKPGLYKEIIKGYHDYAATDPPWDGKGASQTLEYGEHEIAPVYYGSSNPYLLVSDAQTSDFNFYRNQIDMPSICPKPLLTPAAATATLAYSYDLAGTFYEEGKKIYKIQVKPFYKEESLFNGYIYIQDSTWAIVSVDLNVNSGALLFCKDFKIMINYSEVAPGVFLPVRREFTYTIREGAYNILGNTRINHSAYAVNTTFPDKLFNNEVKRYEDDAFDKDSLFWMAQRPIQLDEKELSYIRTTDSIANYYKSPEFLAELDSSFNEINVWSFLLNGVGHRNRARKTEWYFEPLIAQMIFFGVGGYHHRLGGHFNKEFDNAFYLETDGQIDYGFLNKDVRGKMGIGLTYVPKRFIRTFIRFGDYYDMINSYASLTSAFSRSNYVRNKEFSVAQRMEIVNGLFGELTFEFSDQLPITGMKLEQWSQELFDTINTPTDFTRYTKAELKLELKYRIRQKYVIKNKKKIILGSKWPELKLIYRKGIPGLLNSEVDFDYIEIGTTDEMNWGRFGTSKWSVLAGEFFNRRNLRELEHKYFRGSDQIIFSDPVRSFQLLGVTFKTDQTYFRANFIHHFEGLIGNKIPGISKLRITSAAGGGVLMIPSQNFSHVEFYLGLERIVRIRKQLFRFGIFAVTADNTLVNPKLTYKIGISFYNTFTRKWDY